MNLQEISWDLFLLVLGLVLPYVGLVLFSAYENRNAYNISGKWISSYEGINPDDNGVWYAETVELKRTPRGIEFHSGQNQSGYRYYAAGKFHHGKYIIGRWRSTKRGAASKGVFQLTVSVQGDFMFGVYSGQNDEGAFRVSLWAFGRDEAAVDKAKRQLGGQRKP